VTPSAIVEFGIEEDGLAIEMGNEHRIDLTVIDHA
jgi:hypothetical protein